MLNRAVRFIFNLSKRTHITYYLKKLHFLPIKQRIIFKTCLVSFKIFNGKAPESLKTKFMKFVPTTQTYLRPSSGRDEYTFDMKLDDHKANTVINRTKMNWNSLPLQIRKLKFEQIGKFKTDLKTFLFKKAYEIS